MSDLSILLICITALLCCVILGVSWVMVVGLKSVAKTKDETIKGKEKGR